MSRSYVETGYGRAQASPQQLRQAAFSLNTRVLHRLEVIWFMDSL
jgi:hypothetical protein